MGGSDTQVGGLHRPDKLSTKRELQLDRLGMSVVLGGVDCTKAQHNTTSDLCRYKTPGHTMMLQAEFDRHSRVDCTAGKDA